ncbi:MAG: hypothetical protein KGJ79_11210 [Alphaproteobacteria bacterium]|nr:hypothetical protein [Alphaproteobacteria bacterium]
MMRKLRRLSLALGTAGIALASQAAAAPGILDLNNLNDPRLWNAGHLESQMDLCHVDQATQNLVSARLQDWIAYLATGDASVRCQFAQSDPPSNNKVCDTVYAPIMTNFACDQYACNSGPPPSPPPNCADFVPHLRQMRMIRPGWKVTDGLD